MSKKKKTTQRYKPEDAPIVYSDSLNAKSSTVVSTNVVEGSGETVSIREKKVSKGVQTSSRKTLKENEVKEISSEPKSSCTFSDEFLNKTLVSVKILGDRTGKNGSHMMCIANIAKAVINNYDVDRVILVSEKTANAVYDLIVDFPEKIGISEINRETRVTMAERFWSNLKRYGSI